VSHTSQTSRTAAAPPQALRTQLRTSTAGRFLATYWGSVLVVDLTRPLGQAVCLVALVGLVAACSVHQHVAVAIALGLVAWLFVTGFVVNPLGLLAVHGPADAVRLALLTTVAALTAHLTSATAARTTEGRR
jgi:K+-sensing histidine kinase KdpD